MWTITDQEAIVRLNEAVNQQLILVQHLQSLSRWHGEKGIQSDLAQLRENVEEISESLNRAIIWKKVTQ